MKQLLMALGNKPTAHELSEAEAAINKTDGGLNFDDFQEWYVHITVRHTNHTPTDGGLNFDDFQECYVHMTVRHTNHTPTTH